MAHIPVLLKEVLESLEFKQSDKVFLDATVGAGGHSLAVCKNFPWIEILGLDADEEAIILSEKNLKKEKCSFKLKSGNFRELEKALDFWKIEKIDKALFDLGMSSMQIESSSRGFSFQKDEPLIMTLEKDWQNRLTAFEIVNQWPLSEIERVLKEYGEEPFAGKIARAIVKKRKAQPIKTTKELVKIIEEAVPAFYKRKKIHPATRSFQALRIAVNDELKALEEALEAVWRELSEGGRVGIISFHSLEDRIVKLFFRDLKTAGKAILITKKPIVPTREEISKNPRSRSAKLRVVEKK